MLVLVNGAPGAGKSSLADRLVARRPLMLALDIDRIKHSLGRWDDDPDAAGRHARRLALALVREQLGSGHDVAVAQYLARTDFVEDLERTAADHGARFLEVILDLDEPGLARRLRDRQDSPDRPEHAINNALVGPEDAAELVRSLDALRRARPRTVTIDASGSVEDTVTAIAAVLGRTPDDGR